jgi:hypothetical protein
MSYNHGEDEEGVTETHWMSLDAKEVWRQRQISGKIFVWNLLQMTQLSRLLKVMAEKMKRSEPGRPPGW